jgi:hypothetical protein
MDAPDPKKMCQLIRQLRQVALELKTKGKGIQAVERNVDRILASIKMLELNVCDISDSDP